MADKRTDRLIDEKLEQALSDVEKWLNEQKSPAPQFIGGGNVVSFLSDTGNASDWSGNLTHIGSVPNFGAATFLISATANNTGTLYATVINKLFVGSLSSQYTTANYLADEAAGKIAFFSSYTNVPSSSTATNAIQWVLSMNGDIRPTIYLKFYIYALDQVTITVTRLT